MKSLAKELLSCRICADHPAGAPLPHAPRPVFRFSASASICVCGQAPGLRAHQSGIPFSDPSGVRLRDWMGIGEAEFYDAARVAIVPMGFCFPGYGRNGGDLPPRRECAKAWRTRIFETLPQFRLVLLVGSYAQRWHLGKGLTSNTTGVVKAWRCSDLVRNGTRYFPLPHPSWRNNGWLKRNPWFAGELVPELQKEVQKFMKA